jgi:hypothetical protein
MLRTLAFRFLLSDVRNFFTKFRGSLPHSQFYDSVHRLLTEDDDTTFLRNVGKQLLNTQRNSPEDLVPQYESGFATNNVFQVFVVLSV